MSDTASKLQPLEEAIERVSKKQKVSYSKTLTQLDHLLNEVNKCKALLQPVDQMETEGGEEAPQAVTVSPALALGSLQKSVKESNISKKVSEEHKDLHVAISKLGKQIDKLFPTDITKSHRTDVSFSPDVLNTLIAQHFFRKGQFQIGEVFLKESGLQLDVSLKQPFEEMYHVLEAMNTSKNLQPAITWAEQREAELERRNSNLLFKLHKLQFIHLLVSNNNSNSNNNTSLNEAVKYAQTHFPKFAKKEMREIQRLMGSLLYFGRLEQSPYSEFLSPLLWHDIVSDFTSECCSLLGLSAQSPLYIAVTAGALSLPTLLKVASLTQQIHSTKPSGAAFAFQPVEIEISPEFRFHPIFACPVSKEQSTIDNPPMMLTCGHVISKASMVKLARGGNRFKCPYCPSEANTTKAVQVTF